MEEQSIIFEILESWKNQVADQIATIKQNLQGLSDKEWYKNILELETKNRKSITILIDLQQLYDTYGVDIPIEKYNHIRQQYFSISCDNIPYVSVGTRVNQIKKLGSLSQNENSEWIKLNIYYNEMRNIFYILRQEIAQLTNEISKCEDAKVKKRLVNQRYRREENVYYFELLIDTLCNLIFILRYLGQIQQKQSVDEKFQTEIDNQTYTSLNQGMYIRTNAKGRRDKNLLKIVISCLIVIGLMVQQSPIQFNNNNNNSNELKQNESYYEEEQVVKYSSRPKLKFSAKQIPRQVDQKPQKDIIIVSQFNSTFPDNILQSCYNQSHIYLQLESSSPLQYNSSYQKSQFKDNCNVFIFNYNDELNHDKKYELCKDLDYFTSICKSKTH